MIFSEEMFWSNWYNLLWQIMYFLYILIIPFNANVLPIPSLSLHFSDIAFLLIKILLDMVQYDNKINYAKDINIYLLFEN